MAQQVIFKKLRLTVADCVAILLVLFVAVSVFVISGMGDFTARYCVIEINGSEWARYDLAALSEEKIIEIENEYGANTIVVDREGVRVVSSDCPDGLEVKSGKITSSGQSLVCLPHRLVIRLEGKENADATAW